MTTISWARLLLFIVISELAGILGSVFTIRTIPTWYAELSKPSFRPPNWIFGPVWTVLYALQGIAAYLVWEKRLVNANAHTALTLFWIQLALNALWTPLFFGLRRLDLAFYEIILLWIAIVLTILWFWKVNRASAYLLIPYLLWVTFASVLNFSIWRLNE